jgi:hypothetical protein
MEMDPRFLENLWTTDICKDMVVYLHFNKACSNKFETVIAHGKKSKFHFRLIL